MNKLNRYIPFLVSSFLNKFSGLMHSAGHANWLAILVSVSCLICIPVTSLAQVQVGGDIDGVAMGDGAGVSISLSADGNRLALSAQNYNFGTGQVRVYQWSGAAWQQLGGFIDGEEYNDYSGASISLSPDGNRLAIGAHGNDGNGLNSGHVRVYQWSGTTWTQLGADIDGEAENDQSGWRVSLSADGNRVAIGAKYNGGINGVNSGHVRVYEWSGAWTQLGADIDGEAANDQQHSISLSSDGNRLAIGAGYNDDSAPNAGHVRIFEWAGNDWVQLGADIDGEAAYDHSGNSVSLSADGSRVAVGAFGNDDNGAESGHVRIHQWTGTEWSQLGGDIDGAAAYDQFGHAVSISADGNRLAIGSKFHEGDTGIESGHVRVYQWSDPAWTQLGVDIDGEAPEDHSGHSVSMAANGNRLAIGAVDNDGNGDNSGHVRVYDLCTSFEINPGLNDHWYNPLTVGQGVYITVLPDLGKVTLTIFSYDTVLPPGDLTANLGDPSQRWLNALGRYTGNQATMNVSFDYDGIFDDPTETTKVRGYGTIILSFCGCNSGTLEYEIPSLGLSGSVPIQRIAGDNIALCEAFLAQ